MNLYRPNPELGPHYVPGVNPSIALLVLALQAWGVMTIESHAGFYPGDPEEQEYWVQKRGLDEAGRDTYEGPIVLAGVWHDPPHVIFWASASQVERLSFLLPEGWRIVEYSRLRPRANLKAYKLVLESLQFFSDATNAFWDRYLPRLFPDPDGPPRELSSEDVQRINQEYHQAMPLTREKYNQIRDVAIQALSACLLDDIKHHDQDTIKECVERLITWQEDAEFLEELIAVLHEELGEDEAHHFLSLARWSLQERNRHA